MKKLLALICFFTSALVCDLKAQTGAALNFDGVNDYVNVGNFLGANYTKEAWIYITNAAGQNNIISGGSTDGRHQFWAPAIYGNRLSAGHNGVGNQVQDPTPLNLNTWYHVAVTYNGTTNTMTLYKNGVAVSSNAAVTYFQSGNYIRIGSYGTSATTVFGGSMDEVRIYNNVRTPAQIAANYACTYSTLPGSLQQYYRCNQGIAGGTNTGLNTMTDAAGTAQNGNMINFALTGATSNWIAPGAVSSGVVASLLSQSNLSCNGAGDGTATVSATGGTSFTYSWTPSGGTAATATGLSAGTYTCMITNECGQTTTQTVTITEPAAISVNQSGSGSICDGQSTIISANPSGGTGPYSYLWMPGSATASSVNVSPNATTDYTVVVTDNSGCTASGIVSVTVLSNPTLNVSANPASPPYCMGSQVTLTATGAASHAWTGGILNGVPFTASATTTYTVTGTAANGCTSTAQSTVTVINCSNTTQLNATWCGATNCNVSQTIAANNVSGATNYEFWFQNVSLGYSQTRVKGNGTASLPLSWMSGLQYGVTYQVRIRAYVGAAWQPYGPTCTITMAAQSPTTQLTNCAATNLTLSNSLVVNAVAGAQDYEYTISNAQQPLNTVRARGSNINSIGLTWFTGIQYGRTYDCTVRVKVGGVWSAPGPVCTFSMQAAPPSTQLTTLCGASGITASSVLGWTAVTGATNYRVNIANSGLGFSQTKVKGNNGTTMGVSQFSGLLINNTYTVTVSSYIGGAWGPFGPVCTITMGGNVRMENPSAEEESVDFNFGVSMYPNPLGDGINPTINITGADQKDAVVTILDLSGRVVASYQMFVVGDDFMAQLADFPELPAGMYIMQVQVSDQVQSQKFIAQ